MSEEMKNINDQPEETVVENNETQTETVKPQFEEKKPLDKKTIGIIAGAAAAVVAVIAIVIALILGGQQAYNLVVVTDSSIADGAVTNYVLALVTDANGKIVAARFDCVETSPALNETKDAFVAVTDIATKVEQGDGYNMKSGSWAKQTKAFEDYLIGKTADEVANLDLTLVAGCTMPNTPKTFKTLVAKAFDSELKVEFKAGKNITLGAAITTTNSEGSVSSDFAGVVLENGKVVAAMIDSCAQKFSISEGAIVAPAEVAVSKNDQGEKYKMDAGTWASQGQAFANSAVGKTVAELADLETVSDALKAAGCTMKNTTGGYKTTIIAAANNAR